MADHLTQIVLPACVCTCLYVCVTNVIKDKETINLKVGSMVGVQGKRGSNVILFQLKRLIKRKSHPGGGSAHL